MCVQVEYFSLGLAFVVLTHFLTYLCAMWIEARCKYP